MGSVVTLMWMWQAVITFLIGLVVEPVSYREIIVALGILYPTRRRWAIF